MRLFIIAAAIVASIATATTTVSAAPLGTGFTYQGELLVSNAPANGDFDFEFALFDAASGGSEVSTTQFVNDVTVTGGVFSVELDFGVGAFDGEQLWVDVSVRSGSSSGSFTGLLPRQRLTAAPYALHAASAELLNGQTASELVEANRLGTVIDSLPFTITQAGRYYFTGNLTYSGLDRAIYVTADDVFIDMNGFVLTGPGSTGNDVDGIGTTSGRKRMTVINGTVRNFGSQGIVSSATSADGHRIENVRVVGTGDEGIWLSGNGNIVADCYLQNNGGIAAIRISGGIVRGTTVSDATAGGIYSTRATVVDSSVIDALGTSIVNSYGISDRNYTN